MKFAFDLRTNRLTGDVHSGAMGQISWRRLAETFREAGEITDKEQIVIFEASEFGLRFIVTDRKTKPEVAT